MSKTILIIGAVVIVILIAALLLFNQSSEERPIQGIPIDQVPPASEEEQPTFSSNIITYTDSGYSSKEITISKGDTVVFKNESSRKLWPASAVHPTHKKYPGSNIQKCFDNNTENDSIIFDACRGLEIGEKWSFTFNEVGSWGYHNHLRFSHTGKIIVE
ncbi:hypothetical protein IIA94_02360 [Patescibacteria group bacterium]|nr:hypothetical protein [Patescibacteria group bacterium]